MHPQIIPSVENVWKRDLVALGGALDESLRALGNLLRLDEYHRRGHERPQLEKALGPFGAATLDLSSLSTVLGTAAEARCLPEVRRARIETLMETVEELRCFCATPPDPLPGGDIGEDEEALGKKADEHFDCMAGIFRALRIAQLEIHSKYDPGEHDPFFDGFGWRQLTRSEQRLCPPFVITAEAGIGLRKILSLLESGRPVKVAVLRADLCKRGPHVSDPSVATALSVEMLPLALRGAGFLQTCPAAVDFTERVSQALSLPRPGLISLLVPREDEDEASFHLRAVRALRSRAFPAVDYDPDRAPGFVSCLDLSSNPPEEEALTFAEFAAGEPEFAAEISDPPEGVSPGQLVPIAEYLELSRRQRIGKVPCLPPSDNAPEARPRCLSATLVARIADQGHLWRTLRELAGIDNPHVHATRAAVRVEMDARQKTVLEDLREEHASARAHQERVAVASAIRRLVIGFTGVEPSEVDLGKILDASG